MEDAVRDPVDPRVSYSIGSSPSPSPSPGPSPDPEPAPADPSPPPSGPEPTPSPTGPNLPPPWGSDPDVGVTSSFLRDCADACDEASLTVWKTLDEAKDAAEDLARAAHGWGFVQSIDDMHERWDRLNQEMRDRLNRASDNFRRSADAYDGNEIRTAQSFSDIYR